MSKEKPEKQPDLKELVEKQLAELEQNLQKDLQTLQALQENQTIITTRIVERRGAIAEFKKLLNPPAPPPPVPPDK